MKLKIKTSDQKRLLISINSLKGFTNDQKIKIKKACDLLEKIVNSNEFYSEFMGLRFVGPDKGTNKYLYDRLMAGESEYGPADGDIDIDLTYYYSWWSRVIGYGLPGTIKTWINGKFLNGMSIEELSAHIMHEYMHKLNLDDDYGDRSVPYQVGDLVERLAKR